ncbi:MAG TPA: NAD(P)H-hydrate dehydratase [Allosphingosinicella sp.]|nr:NAD(P)H-hydrate dehydratase [Allosphingosinicella sp.]
MTAPKPAEPRTLDRDLLAAFPLPALPEDGDKEDRGRVLVIAGGREVPGAAVLTGIAAQRAGSGKLQIVTHADVAIPVGVAVTGARVIAGFDDCVTHVGQSGAVVIGCGMDPGKSVDRLVAAILEAGGEMPLILDAAALDCLAGREERIRGWAGGIALLPHSREMARMLDCAPEEVEIDPLHAAERAAAAYGAVTLVKGRFSFIAAPDGQTFRFEGGGIGLATSGSGDVLAGIVAGIAARGADILTAVLWGVWLHGEAGRVLTDEIGRVGFLADELPGRIPALLASVAA